MTAEQNFMNTVVISTISHMVDGVKSHVFKRVSIEARVEDIFEVSTTVKMLQEAGKEIHFGEYPELAEQICQLLDVAISATEDTIGDIRNMNITDKDELIEELTKMHDMFVQARR